MSRTQEFWIGLLGVLAICGAALALSGCSPADRQRIRDAAQETGARDAATAACALAHGFDGQIPEAEAVVRWCSKAEYAKPWIELTEQAAALVDAQRAGKVRPD
jgi:hypothetical protein